MRSKKFWVPFVLLIVGVIFIIWGLAVEGEFGATWKQVLGFSTFGLGFIALCWGGIRD